MRLDVSRGAVPPFRPCNLRQYGHSFMAGGGASRFGVTDFPARIGNALDPAAYTSGYAGFGSQTTVYLLTQAAAYVDAFVDPAKYNVFTYYEIGNSILNYVITQSMTPAAAATQTIADMTAMFSGRRAAGFQACICYTAIAFFNITANCLTALDLVNAWVRGTAMSSGIIDDFIDARADTRFANMNFSTGHVSGDGTHPNDYGGLLLHDISIPVIQRVFETKGGGPAHAYSPRRDGLELIANYEAWDDPAFVTYNTVTRKISTLLDRSTWKFDLSAAGALQPALNLRNAAFGNTPTIDALASCMTTALSMDLSFTNKLYILALYICNNSGVFIAEFSENSGLHADTFKLVHHVAGTGPEPYTFGNVGTSRATSNDPAAVKSVSFVLDHSINTAQLNVLIEGVTAGGITHTDAPNTNYFGSRQLSLFDRQGGGIAAANMSLAALYMMATPPSAPRLARLLADLMSKRPH